MGSLFTTVEGIIEKISEQNDKVHLIAKGGSVDLLPNTEKIGFNSKTKRSGLYCQRLWYPQQ